VEVDAAEQNFPQNRLTEIGLDESAAGNWVFAAINNGFPT
jgi:hypothetical protein